LGDGDKAIPWGTFVQIRQEIDAIPTLRKIDIVDLNRVEKKFKNEALKSGQKL
jgi:hypothetical protein